MVEFVEHDIEQIAALRRQQDLLARIPALLVDFDDSAMHDAWRGLIARKQGDLSLQLFRVPQVVTVEESDELCGRSRNAGVSRRRSAPMRDVDDPKCRPVPGVVPEDRGRAIRGTIVDDDHALRLQRLCADTVETGSDEKRTISDRDHHVDSHRGAIRHDLRARAGSVDLVALRERRCTRRLQCVSQQSERENQPGDNGGLGVAHQPISRANISEPAGQQRKPRASLLELHAVPGAEFTIELLEGFCGPLDTEILQNPVAAGIPPSPTQVGVVRETDNGATKVVRVLARDQQPGFFVLDQFGRTADRRCDDRQARTHGFDDVVRQAFRMGCTDVKVGGGQDQRHVVPLAEKHNPVRDAQPVA